MVYTIPSHGTYQAYHGAFYGVLVGLEKHGEFKLEQGASRLHGPGHTCEGQEDEGAQQIGGGT